MYDDNDSDVFVGTDEDGNRHELKIERYFFYNGEKYVLLSQYNEEDSRSEGKDIDPDEMTLYVMQVKETVDEDGEAAEEFIPVDENLMETLIQVVQTKFASDEPAAEEDLDDN
jgi:hypothetical protein